MNPLVSEQTFDWIFFAIMIPPPLFLVWDWFRNRVPDGAAGSAKR